MKATYSVTEAQKQLPSILRQVENGSTVAVTRHDATVAFFIGRKRLEATVETLELLGTSKAMKAIEADRENRAKFIPLPAADDDAASN